MISQQLAIECLLSFFSGSIPFAVIAMWGSGIDIREVGSGNPGFNNVLRVSKPRAIVTLIGDMGKGFLPVWLFTHVGMPEYQGWIYGFAAVLGHCYSPWLKFNGGKGIATSAGVMLAIYPLLAAAGLAFFVVLRLTGKKRGWPEAGALASVTTWVFFTVLMGFVAGPVVLAWSAAMTVFVAWRHKSNAAKFFAELKAREAGA